MGPSEDWELTAEAAERTGFGTARRGAGRFGTAERSRSARSQAKAGLASAGDRIARREANLARPAGAQGPETSRRSGGVACRLRRGALTPSR